MSEEWYEIRDIVTIEYITGMYTCTHLRVSLVLALDLEGVHDLKLHHPSSSVATSNQ